MTFPATTNGHPGEPVHPDSPMGLAGRVASLERHCEALDGSVRALAEELGNALLALGEALGGEDDGSAADALSAALKASQERAAAKRRALRESLTP